MRNMQNKIIEILNFFGKIYIRIKNIFSIRKIINEKSYYPEKKRKSKLKRFKENFFWIIKNVEYNKYYNLYGFDIESNINQNDYIDYRTFKIQRDEKNGYSKQYNYVSILIDKNIFEKYIIVNNIKTVKTLAIIRDVSIYDSNLNNKIDIKELIKDKSLFIKSIDDECGRGIYCINNYEDLKKIQKKINKGLYIVQEKLIQHETMKKLNSNSINTIRIITILKENKVHVFGILLRIGTKKSGFVDNSSQGGIVVPVSIAGKLNEVGFSKPGYGGIQKKHPDSKIEFSKFKIPYFNEALELVKSAHKTLYKIHSIGWDVAITPNGPILIEGNDNWEIQSIQSIGGLKEKWKKYL